MNKNLFFAILAMLVLLQSCTMIHIVTNKDPGYTKKPNKVYIIVDGSSQTKKYCERLLSGLKTEFNTRQIPCDGFLRDPLSLEMQSDIQAKITVYNPDALLIIKQTQVTTTDGNITGQKFEVSLIDEQTKKTVWKGVMDVNSSVYSSEVDQSVQMLIQKMQADQLL